MKWQDHFKANTVTADEAVKNVKNGNRIFVSGNATLPTSLTDALVRRGNELEGVEMNHLLTFGVDKFHDIPGIRHNAWFLGPSIRKTVNEAKGDYIPIFLGEIAALVRSGEWPIDIALINVSPPDKYGYMSYGVETSVTKPCAEVAKFVIAQVNSKMPRAMGDCFIHVSQVDKFVLFDEYPTVLPSEEPGEIETQIGKNVASLIQDEATIQMGIGGIPNATLKCLFDKKDLGIHTEMFSDGILPLLEEGVITNEKKEFHRGKIISGFVMGSQDLYNYIDNNPLFEFHPSHYTNDPFRIARNHRMTAINSAIEVDLTGQVCADSMGEMIYSGIGGQVDFIRGAARAKEGRPIIALPSTAKGGKVSRISLFLNQGSGVVTSRGDVHYIVTEYGIANLFGKNLRQRAEALISIAHPDFRAELRRDSKWALK